MPTISHRQGTSRTVNTYHCTHTVTGILSAGILTIGSGGFGLTLRKSGTGKARTATIGAKLINIPARLASPPAPTPGTCRRTPAARHDS
jgi:hypothetical protein